MLKVRLRLYSMLKLELTLILKGYWMPYAAAKALAAKFCYRIRFALTVIFGPNFPNECLPEDHEEFGNYTIAPEIIAECRRLDEENREFELARTSIPPINTTTPAKDSLSSAPSQSVRKRTRRSVPQPQKQRLEPRASSVYFDPVRDCMLPGNESTEPNSRTATPEVYFNMSPTPSTRPDLASVSAESSFSSRPHSLSPSLSAFPLQTPPEEPVAPASHQSNPPQIHLTTSQFEVAMARVKKRKQPDMPNDTVSAQKKKKLAPSTSATKTSGKATNTTAASKRNTSKKKAPAKSTVPRAALRSPSPQPAVTLPAPEPMNMDNPIIVPDHTSGNESDTTIALGEDQIDKRKSYLGSYEYQNQSNNNNIEEDVCTCNCGRPHCASAPPPLQQPPHQLGSFHAHRLTFQDNTFNSNFHATSFSSGYSRGYDPLSTRTESFLRTASQLAWQEAQELRNQEAERIRHELARLDNMTDEQYELEAAEHEEEEEETPEQYAARWNAWNLMNEMGDREEVKRLDEKRKEEERKKREERQKRWDWTRRPRRGDGGFRPMC